MEQAQIGSVVPRVLSTQQLVGNRRTICSQWWCPRRSVLHSLEWDPFKMRKLLSTPRAFKAQHRG